MSPFFAGHGSYLSTIKKFRPESPQTVSTSPQTPVEKTSLQEDWSVKTRGDVVLSSRDHKVLEPSSPQEQLVSRKRPVPAFEVGDEVFLRTRDYVTLNPPKTLDVPCVGPFYVTKVIKSVFYQLKLPKELDPLHNFFHASLLVPVKKSQPASQTKAPSSVFMPKTDPTDNQPMWTVDKILDPNRPDGKLYFFVRWKGPAKREKIWEPPPNLVAAVIDKETVVNGLNVTQKIYVILC